MTTPHNRYPVLINALLVLGFLFGLAIPRYSFLALLGCAGLLLRTPFSLPRIWKVSVPVLLVFTVMHESISVYYGLRNPSVLLVHPLMFLSAYFIGLAVPSISPAMDEGRVARLLVVISLGMALFALLGAALKPIRVEGADLLRKAPNFWDPSFILNGTIYGLYASIGMAMLPIAIFGNKKMSGIRIPDLILAAFAGVSGLLANILFQNRSPFFALGMAGLWVMWELYFRSGKTQGLRGSAQRRMLGLIVFIVGIYFLFPEQLSLLFLRFQVFGLNSGGRTSAWINVITHILDQPFGGRVIDLAGLSYAHNLWLDVANDSGVVPLLLMTFWCFLHLPSILGFLRRPPGYLKLTVVCLGSASLMGAMVEPLLIGSPVHFAFICLLLGLIVGTSKTDFTESGITHGSRFP